MSLPKNIFLAEDDQDDIDFFTDALTDICKKSTLTVFRNGAKLIDGLRYCKRLPDIVFLDINMPVMSGLDALAEIKNSPLTTNVPTIIYSTSSHPDDISKAYRLGASSYFKKPQDFKDLQSQLKNILLMDWNNFLRPNNQEA